MIFWQIWILYLPAIIICMWVWGGGRGGGPMGEGAHGGGGPWGRGPMGEGARFSLGGSRFCNKNSSGYTALEFIDNFLKTYVLNPLCVHVCYKAFWKSWLFQQFTLFHGDDCSDNNIPKVGIRLWNVSRWSALIGGPACISRVRCFQRKVQLHQHDGRSKRLRTLVLSIWKIWLFIICIKLHYGAIQIIRYTLRGRGCG